MFDAPFCERLHNTSLANARDQEERLGLRRVYVRNGIVYAIRGNRVYRWYPDGGMPWHWYTEAGWVPAPDVTVLHSLVRDMTGAPRADYVLQKVEEQVGRKINPLDADYLRVTLRDMVVEMSRRLYPERRS
jgi:hypothetical protein